MFAEALSKIANLKILMRKKLDSRGGYDENAASRLEGFPSGQRDQTVNLTS